MGRVLLQGCHRSGNGEGKKFFEIREKSGNFILSQEKSTLQRKVGKFEII